MPNFSDLIGTFMRNAAAPSGQDRMGNILDDLKRTGLGGTGEAGGQGASTGGLLGGLLDAVQGGLSSAAQNPMQAGGIGAALGGLLGGGGDAVKGALGGGALAMLASVAMKALANGGQAGGAHGFSGGDMPIGLKIPQTPHEEQRLADTAELILKGMINAAKADGEISAEETQRIVGKMKESGMDAEGQRWVMREMQRPLDLDAFVAEIPSPEVAAEVYAASLLAIEVDTPEEQQYLQQFAQRTGLNPMVVQYIHRSMGVA